MVRIERQHGGPESYGDAPGDAIIVGGGPAGAVTALGLARRGLRPVILDRAEFPRPKPCGDCLSAAATALLDRLGLLPAVAAADPAWLGGWRIVSPGGFACDGRFGEVRGLALERRHLDRVLLDAAVGAGARVCRLRVTGLVREPDGRVGGVVARDPDGAEHTLRAALTVGADGLRSVVARRLGAIRRPPRLRKLSLTAHAEIDLANPEIGEMRVLEGGCFGLAPAGRGRVNITLVTDAAHGPRLGRIGARAFLAEWALRSEGLGPLVESLPFDEEILASGPFDWPTHAVTAPGAALVGDAAGYYDPFTGQGIYQAMAAADRLAEHTAPALRRARGSAEGGARLDGALRRYAAEHRRITAPARRLQRLIEAVLSRPWAADAALRRLAAAPAVADRLIEVTGDLRRPRSLFSAPLLRSFLVPPSALETA